MKKFYICLIILFVFTSMLTAQMSREDLEEALKYFPAGICGSIAHVDDQALSDSKIFNKYRGAFDEKFDLPPLDILPPSLRESIISRSMSDITRLYKFSDKQLDSEKLEDGSVRLIGLKESVQRELNTEVSGYTYGTEKIDGKTVYVNLANVAFKNRVYRYENLGEKILLALKAREITVSSKKLLDRPVYQFSFKNHLDRSFDLVAYATEGNEFLVAQSYSLLQEMLKAEDGSAVNLMEDLEYRDLLLELSDKMTEKWSVSIISATSKLQLETFNKVGGTSERKARLEEQLECGLTYMFKAESFQGKHLTQEQMFMCSFPVQEAVAHRLSPFKNRDSWPEEVNNFYKEIDKFTTHSLDEDKNVLSITTVHNEKILEKKVEINKVTSKLRAERKAKREAEKAKAAK